MLHANILFTISANEVDMKDSIRSHWDHVLQQMDGWKGYETGWFIIHLSGWKQLQEVTRWFFFSFVSTHSDRANQIKKRLTESNKNRALKWSTSHHTVTYYSRKCNEIQKKWLISWSVTFLWRPKGAMTSKIKRFVYLNFMKVFSPSFKAPERDF